MLDQAILQERLNNFNPEPLITFDPKSNEVLERHMIEESENVIDLVKANYLNVLNSDEIKKASEDIIRDYGVGTCGPRAFYGTTDVHLNLEECIAKFLNMEESIVYSYGFVAISSSIAAYCKSKDIVFIDEKANVPIEQGLVLARCQVVKFKHNDPEDFYNKAKEIYDKESKKRARKFLIIEGISWRTGKICPVLDFIKAAEEFKMRIFLEETYSFGVLGEHGRGMTEHFNFDNSRVDMVFGTLEGAIGSIGGFCAGSSTAIEHQRLSGSGYIYSASLPTYLAQVGIKSIEMLEDKPKRLVELAKKFHSFLEDSCKFEVISDPLAPFKIFTAKDTENKHEKEMKVLNFCKEKGVYFLQKENGLFLNLNVELDNNKERYDKICTVLKEASENL